MQSVSQRLGIQAVAEPVSLSPARQRTDVAIVQEYQLQQLTIEPVREQPLTMEWDTTGKVSFNEERLTPVYTPDAGRVAAVLTLHTPPRLGTPQHRPRQAPASCRRKRVGSPWHRRPGPLSLSALSDLGN